ncbi:virion core protein, T7 gp14 family [Azospirillum sp. sgz301742]
MANNAFLISSAVSAMGTVATLAAQSSQQQSQKKYAAAQADAIRANTIAGYDQLGLQKQQELANASQKIGATSLDAAKARARARVAAGEAGVSGISVDALMADFSRQEGTYNSTVEENYARKSAQLDLNMQGLQKGAQGQINQIPEPKAPDFTGAALRLGGDVMKAYAAFGDDRSKLKIPT